MKSTPDQIAEVLAADNRLNDEQRQALAELFRVAYTQFAGPRRDAVTLQDAFKIAHIPVIGTLNDHGVIEQTPEQKRVFDTWQDSD